MRVGKHGWYVGHSGNLIEKNTRSCYTCVLHILSILCWLQAVVFDGRTYDAPGRLDNLVPRTLSESPPQSGTQSESREQRISIQHRTCRLFSSGNASKGDHDKKASDHISTGHPLHPTYSLRVDQVNTLKVAQRRWHLSKQG